MGHLSFAWARSYHPVVAEGAAMMMRGSAEARDQRNVQRCMGCMGT